MSPWEIDTKAGISLEDRVKREWERRQAAAIPTPVLTPDVVKPFSEPVSRAENQWTYPPRARSADPNSIGDSSPVDSWEIIDDLASPREESPRNKGKGRDITPEHTKQSQEDQFADKTITQLDLSDLSSSKGLSTGASAQVLAASLLSRPLPPVPAKPERLKKKAPPPPPPLRPRRDQGPSQGSFLDLDPEPMIDPEGPSERAATGTSGRQSVRRSSDPDYQPSAGVFAAQALPSNLSADIVQKRRRPLPEPPSSHNKHLISAFDTLQFTSTAGFPGPGNVETADESISRVSSSNPSNVQRLSLEEEPQAPLQTTHLPSPTAEGSEYTDLDVLVSQLEEGEPGSHYDVRTRLQHIHTTEYSSGVIISIATSSPR